MVPRLLSCRSEVRIGVRRKKNPGVKRTKREEDNVDLPVSGFQRGGPTVADGLSFEPIAVDELSFAFLDEGLHLCIVVESIG